jgi:CheY-like chemotaxis protein
MSSEFALRTVQRSHLGRVPSVLVVANRSTNDRLISTTLGPSCKRLERVPQSEALAAARGFHPDLIILDGGDAPARSAAFLGAIRRDSELSGTRVLILSYGSHADESDWRRAGADGCISGRLESRSLLDHASELLGLQAWDAHEPTVAGPPEDAWRQMSRTVHDDTMQRLFAIGMSLERIGRAETVADVSRRVGDAITELDSTILSIRSVIFEGQ